MRPSRLAAASLVLLAVGALSSCAPPAVDQVALERWHADRAARGADDGSLTVLTASAPAGATGDRVGIDLAAPVIPTSLTFECFGEGTISLQVDGATVDGSRSTTTTVGPLDCADGPHELDPTAVGRTAVARVGAIGYRADRDTAWSLTVHGDPVAP
jgi:hypothetical protein